MGDLGGYIESASCLSNSGRYWVYNDAMVYTGAKVYGNARVYGEALVCGTAHVYGRASIYGDARVYDDAQVYGDARVCASASAYGNSCIRCDAWIYGSARVCGDVEICNHTHVYNSMVVDNNNRIFFVGHLGTKSDIATFIRTNSNKILVQCNDFRGDIDEFESRVNDNTDDVCRCDYTDAINCAKKVFDRRFPVNRQW